VPTFLSKPVFGSKINCSHIPANGLAGMWLFNQKAGTIADDSYAGNTGTLIGGATWETNPYGQGILFDGVSGTAVSVPELPFSRSYTIMLLLNSSTAGPSRDFQMVFSAGAGANYGPYMSVGANRVNVYSGTTGATWLDGTINVPNDTWNIVACHGSADGHAVWVNGILDSSNSSPSHTGSWNPGRDIGRRVDNGDVFSGRMAGVWIWNRVLSASEHAAIISDPFGMVRPRRVPIPLSLGITPQQQWFDTNPITTIPNQRPVMIPY